MQKILLFVDKLSTWVGHAFSFFIVALTLHISWEVFSRYVLDSPRAWAFDVMIMMYGTLFMMAGAYTLAKNGHVRGDVLYGFFMPRTQATLDLTLYIVFFLPGVIALTYSGYFYAADSWRINEHSNITYEGPPYYPFKTVIPLAGAILLVQGIVEIIRCVICIKQGYWPSREEDVQEVDVEKLKEMVHVKDEDIAKLDQYVTRQGERPVKVRKELWFGFAIMALIIIPVIALTPWTTMTNGHLGLLMLALIVVAIMLGFPTAFTLMGMGVFFGWLSYRSVNPDTAGGLILEMFVQRTYGVMSNDVLIAIPLFLFMGYLVERAQLIDQLFHSLHLALARVPGALAVATIITCAIFATATGIVGAVVTLMGLLAFPAMLKAGYNIKVSAGAITAGGCLGILIPPSVLLIVYGAVAGVSVVQLYAGAFLPGFMLAGLYVGYVVLLAWWKPELMPPLAQSERKVPLPAFARALAQHGNNALTGLTRALGAGAAARVGIRTMLAQLVITLLPALFIVAILGITYRVATAPVVEDNTAGLVQAGGEGAVAAAEEEESIRPIGQEESESDETGKEGEQAPEAKAQPAETPAPRAPAAAAAEPAPTAAAAEPDRLPVPIWYWIVLAIAIGAILLLFWLWNWERLEIFKMLLTSFFPLALLIVAVLGSIVFGLSTPSEAAAVGGFGGFLLAAVYRYIARWKARRPGGDGTGAMIWGTVRELGTIVKESSFLTAKTSAMVCWLFVGSGVFSAAFALLGGQELIEKWVLSLDMTPVQFMMLAQFIIFILGWPLEWTEIIIIFMPIFLPLLPHFNIDPLFFGLLVALNLQTAFLSPPVAMAAFYLKGVSPPHVTLNQIFAGMMPFMGIQLIALVMLYVFPQIGLWLPSVLYGR